MIETKYMHLVIKKFEIFKNFRKNIKIYFYVNFEKS